MTTLVGNFTTWVSELERGEKGEMRVGWQLFATTARWLDTYSILIVRYVRLRTRSDGQMQQTGKTGIIPILHQFGCALFIHDGTADGVYDGVSHSQSIRHS